VFTICSFAVWTPATDASTLGRPAQTDTMKCCPGGRVGAGSWWNLGRAENSTRCEEWSQGGDLLQAIYLHARFTAGGFRANAVSPVQLRYHMAVRRPIWKLVPPTPLPGWWHCALAMSDENSYRYLEIMLPCSRLRVNSTASQRRQSCRSRQAPGSGCGFWLRRYLRPVCDQM
jgi:hypothetical protein